MKLGMRCWILFFFLPLCCRAPFASALQHNSTELFNATSLVEATTEDEFSTYSSMSETGEWDLSTTEDDVTFNNCTAVSNLSANEEWQKGSAVLTLRWTLPDNSKAASICITIQSNDKTCSGRNYCLSKPDVVEEVLYKLCPYHNYTFSVQVVCNNQQEEVSIQYKTKPGEPSAPKGMHLSTSNATSLKICWEKPEQTNGQIDGYVANYSSYSGDENKYSKILPRSSCWLIGDLQPWTEYTVTIAAFNNFSEDVRLVGPTTEEKFTTLESDSGPPKEVLISSITSSSFSVEWKEPDHPNGLILRYVVSWKIVNEENGTWSKNASATARSLEVMENVLPYTEYSVYVQAVNKVGLGVKSNPVSFGTETGIPGPPMNLSFQKVTNTTLNLVWDPPNITNGIIQLYTVEWSSLSDGTSYRNTSKTNKLLWSLLPFTNYTVRVSAWTSAGNGNWSSPVFETTDVGVPDIPENVRAEVNASSILVYWNEPKKKNGPIDGYVIVYRRRNATPKSEHRFQPRGKDYHFLLQKLEPWTEYDIELSAFNKNKDQKVIQSKPVILHERTLEYYPGVIDNINVRSITNATMSLGWSPPAEPNGIITEYVVHYNSSIKLRNQTSKGTDIVLNDLLPFTNYTIRVAASTAVGWGNFSAAITVRTDVGVPNGPVGLGIRKILATEMIVAWTEPSYKAGPIDGYLITWWEDDAPEESRKVYDTNLTHFNMTELKPWTNYTLKIQPYNINKRSEVLVGGTAVVHNRTAAAVPLAPVINATVVQSSTSVWLEWVNRGTYPGPTTYVIQVWKKNDACSNRTQSSYLVQNHTDETMSWNISMTTVRNLEPYTVYFFRVVAATEVGSAVSRSSMSVVTESDAPSQPQNFQVNCSVGSTYALLSWDSPRLKNGVIIAYRIVYASAKDFQSKVQLLNLPPVTTCQTTSHSLELHGLHPEIKYKFAVQAKTQGVERYGHETQYNENCILPAGVPPIPDNSSKPEVQDTSPQDVTLKWSKMIFSAEMGHIIYYSLIVASPDVIGLPRSGSMGEIEPLPVWAEFWNQVSDIYQATPHNWNPFHNNIYDPLNCRISMEFGEDILHCTVGWEKNCTLEKNSYCNGPLKPGKVYGMKLRGFTKGGFAETYPFFVVTDPPDNSVTLGLSIGLVLSFLVLVAVFVVYVLMKKRNRTMSLSQIMVFFRKSSVQVAEPTVVLACTTNGVPVEIKQHRSFDFPTFLEHVKDMMSDSALKFSVEYEDLKQSSARHSCSVAEMEENRPKNRWTNILPFDHSRVKLLPIDDEPGSDYINASYIPGFFSHREYIASQGPLPSTVDDFWRMVWEQKVSMIVMLAQCVERGKTKCEQYWPQSGSESMYYGDLKVQMTSECILSAYTIRTFNMLLGSRQYEVKHMHYTRWPDFGCPESPEELINFVRAVRDHLSHKNCGPILVHCSAGVGRTGTFIAVDRLLQHIQYNNWVHVYNIVLEMREHRINMVQTEDQYIYIHKCLRDLILEKMNCDADNCDSIDATYSNVYPQKTMI